MGVRTNDVPEDASPDAAAPGDRAADAVTAGSDGSAGRGSADRDGDAVTAGSDGTVGRGSADRDGAGNAATGGRDGDMPAAGPGVAAARDVGGVTAAGAVRDDTSAAAGSGGTVGHGSADRGADAVAAGPDGPDSARGARPGGPDSDASGVAGAARNGTGGGGEKPASRRPPAVTRDTARPEGGGRAAAKDAPAPARQWPLLTVLGLTAAGVLVVGTDAFAEAFRIGAMLIGVALITGAVLRRCLPSVGMLAVRSRFTDMITYGVLGVAIVLLALVTQPKPWLDIPILEDAVHFTVR
ncbi:DUF3017 domain-containing protein [Streptomyces sp. NPDC015127]|uniref:DUF3017 domain-containing protein n=1 Tax=Streptomyces sp. NPDC015127 TaxID=3364939 RepID=UPI0036FEAC7E